MLFHVQYATLCAHICLHAFPGFLCRIYLLSPIIFCFADGMCKPRQCPRAAPRRHRASPCIGRLGSRWSSFEPITQPDPLIITNLPESLIWGLPNSVWCTIWLSLLSSWPPSLPLHYVCEESVSKRRVKKAYSAHICTPISGDIPTLWNKTSMLVGQYSGNIEEKFT